MQDICEKLQPENWQNLSASERKELLSSIVNDSILEPNGYDDVDLVADDPNDPKCGSDPACFHDDDEKIYFNEDTISDLPPEQAVNLMTHEALHAMDNEDFGSSKAEEMLGDEVADHHTFRFDWPPGTGDEDGVTRYEQGDIIPGRNHVDEVYIPADEISGAIFKECDKARANGKPLTIESLKRRIAKRLREILNKRWKP